MNLKPSPRFEHLLVHSHYQLQPYKQLDQITIDDKISLEGDYAFSLYVLIGKNNRLL